MNINTTPSKFPIDFLKYPLYNSKGFIGGGSEMSYYVLIKIFFFLILLIVALESWCMNIYGCYCIKTIYKRIKLHILLRIHCHYFLMKNLDTDKKYIAIIYQYSPKTKYFMIEEELFKRWYPRELSVIENAMTNKNIQIENKEQSGE